jgi:phenylalanyl-tRNA synthetase alpha subunit
MFRIMEEKYLCLLTLGTANTVNGQKTLKFYYKKFPIIKETEKTITVKKLYFSNERILKQDLLVIKNLFRNDRIDLQVYTTWCTLEDLQKGKDLLINHLNEQMSKFIDIYRKTMENYKNFDFKITEKND